MNRSRAFGLATAISATAAGAVFAVGANFGLFGAPRLASAPALPVVTSALDPSGSTTTVAPPPRQVVEDIEYVDVPVQVTVPAVSAGAEDDRSAPVAAEAAPLVPVSPTTRERHDPEGADTSPTVATPHDGQDFQPCEVHDDGQVECHAHADD